MNKLERSIESQVALKTCKLQEQALIELISLTGFNIHTFDLKGIEGARYAIERIKEEGYIISSIETNNALKVSYILQRYGKTIAQRDVLVSLKISDKVAEGGAKQK